MVERGDALRQYRFEWPAFDALFLAGAMRWLMLLLIVGGAIWLLRGMARPPAERRAESETT
jgi:hypothetical protein